jgi:hypothetical protein
MLGVDPLTLRSWDTAEPAPAERRRPDHDARSRVGQEGQARCGMAHPGGRGGRTCGRRDIRLVSMSRAFRRAPPPQPQLHSVSYPPLLASPPSNPSCFRDHSITALAFGLPLAPHRPEKHERRREWVYPAEALARIQRWYTDEQAREEVDEDTTVADAPTSNSGGDRQAKKEAKGGAMEMALRTFAERRELSL